MRVRQQQNRSNPLNQTPHPVSPPISPLRRRMIDDMTIRNMSPATQRSYLHAVKSYNAYFGRSPERLAPGAGRLVPQSPRHFSPPTGRMGRARRAYA